MVIIFDTLLFIMFLKQIFFQKCLGQPHLTHTKITRLTNSFSHALFQGRILSLPHKYTKKKKKIGEMIAI